MCYLVLFTSNFLSQFHFSLEMFRLGCNSLKTRIIFVNQGSCLGSCRFLIFWNNLLAPTTMSHKNSLKTLILRINRHYTKFTGSSPQENTDYQIIQFIRSTHMLHGRVKVSVRSGLSLASHFGPSVYVS